jgi:hypothetical protein
MRQAEQGQPRPATTHEPMIRTTKLLVGGAGQPDTSLCERCEYRRYLAATGGRDLANEERARWGQPLIPRPELR